MAAVIKSTIPLLAPIIRTPEVGVAVAEVGDSALAKKIGLRPQETFSRSVITFRSDREASKDRGPIVGGPIKGTYSSSYAKRADRRSLRLLGITAVIVSVLIGTFMVSARMRHASAYASSKNMPAEITSSGTDESDADQMEISTRDQRSSMNEKITRARADKEAAEAAQVAPIVDVTK